jgi:hypothetical protein
MKEIITSVRQLTKMNELICRQRTGSPDEFARYLGISRRAFFEYLCVLRFLAGIHGVLIIYDRYLKTYRYSRIGKINLNLSWTDSID